MNKGKALKYFFTLNPLYPFTPPNDVCQIHVSEAKDGDHAQGLKEQHDTGAKTIVGQNSETCVVYGMPKEAFKLGAVDKEVALESISSMIIKLVT